MNLSNLRPVHWLALAGMLGTIGLHLHSATSWGQVATPAFVSEILLSASSTLVALFSNAPRDPNATTRDADRRRPPMGNTTGE